MKKIKLNKKLQATRNYAQSQFKKNTTSHVAMWDDHVVIVEKYAQWLLTKLPEAKRDITLLGVWFHDIARAYNEHAQHDVKGAEYARQYLLAHHLDSKVITQVYEACRAHKAENIIPESLEAKIVASADAMSHFDNSFFLTVFYSWSHEDKTAQELKKKLLMKVERDYREKIFFDFARQKIKKHYQAWKQIFNPIHLT